MKMPNRAINIFINDKIMTSVLDKKIFSKIVELFEKEGFDFKTDSKLRMILINSTSEKWRKERERKNATKKSKS